MSCARSHARPSRVSLLLQISGSSTSLIPMSVTNLLAAVFLIFYPFLLLLLLMLWAFSFRVISYGCTLWRLGLSRAAAVMCVRWSKKCLKALLFARRLESMEPNDYGRLNGSWKKLPHCECDGIQQIPGLLQNKKKKKDSQRGVQGIMVSRKYVARQGARQEASA